MQVLQGQGFATGLSKSSDTRRNVIASPSDDAVIHAMHHLLRSNLSAVSVIPTFVCSSNHCFRFLGSGPIG